MTGNTALSRCVRALIVVAVSCRLVVAAQGQGRLVIANIRVFTGVEVLERATITIDGGTISQISSRAPANADLVIDGEGRTALPGLIDSHVHILAGTAGVTEAETLAFIRDKLADRMRGFLQHGVTTVKSAGDPTDLILKIRQDLRDGALAGPRLLVTGPVFTSPGGHPATTICQGDAWCRSVLAVEVDSEQEARLHVRRLRDAGVDAIKLIYQSSSGRGLPITKLRPEVMRAIVEEARAVGLPVTAHVQDESSALEVLAAGASGVEHGPREAPSSDALARALKTPERSLVPTLASTLTPAKSGTIAALYKAGVRIVVGTDTSGPFPAGEVTVLEIETLVKAGMTTEAVLRAATSVAATHLGLENKIGTLAPGMTADILIVRGNPLENITDLRQVDHVIQEGNIVFRASASSR